MAVHPPVLQPEEAPFYRPTFDRDEVSSHSSRRSKSSHASQHSKGSTTGSLTELIDPKLIGSGGGGGGLRHGHEEKVRSPDTLSGSAAAYGASIVVNPMLQRHSVVAAASGPSGPSGTTIARRRGSILLGDEQQVPVTAPSTAAVHGQMMSPLPGTLNVVGQGPGFISPQQLYMTQLQAQIAQQQQAQLQQQQAMLIQMAMQNQTAQSMSTPLAPSMAAQPAAKRARSSFAIHDQPHHGHSHHHHAADDEKAGPGPGSLSKGGDFEWVQTPELWRGGRVDVAGGSVSVQGSVCVVANVEISAVSARGAVAEWAVFIEKIPNRCWIGIVPGPLLEIGGRWKIGECPPTEGVGVESTYGMIYRGASKMGEKLFRAPKNRDVIRFKVDFAKKTLSGSLNDESAKVWCSGQDLPETACIAIINSTGRGKFQLRRGPKAVHSK